MTAAVPGSVDAAFLAATYSPGGILVRRWAGSWVDFVVVALMLVTPDWVLGNDLYQQTLYIWLPLAILYFPVTEGLTGRSLGKVVTGTRVVTANGQHPGLWKAAIRTVLRLVEVNPFVFGGLPAGIAVIASSHRQRLGDMAAGTYVVLMSDLPQTQRR